MVPRVHLIIKNINGLQDYLKDKLSILKERNLLEFIEEEINKSLKIKIKEFEEEILKKIKDIKNIKNLKIKCEKEEEDNNKEEINENPRILRPINFFFKSINKEEMEKLFDNINKKKQIEILILVEKQLEVTEYYLIGKFFKQDRIDITNYKTIENIEVKRNYDGLYNKYIKNNKILKEKK